MQTTMESPKSMDWVELLEQEGRALVAALDAHPDASRLFAGTLDREGYVHYLVQTYHYVRWSLPLLKGAGTRLKHLGRHPRLADLLLQKAEEERGHERWLLTDLKNLGCSEERVLSTGPSPAVEAYTSWNFFTSRAGIPTAFLGTAYVLEYLSVTRATGAAEHLIQANAIANIGKAVTFLRGHGGLDEDHVAELTSVLRTLTDVEEQSAVLLSARTTRVVYPGFFRER
ncbi:iron-containing redox enzyme family protein [Myxococcus llanfairpwllgwyngyllgogerychwyrndrobwllllantysiliogogogochensis]|uniref:Iron-containing redox enzyme family protein n=1 Tax=Myxococcus llanfairpwllgwyngyllgogerychwyrndrobwllllantysiliogogogochensis TaxID=2590453 RepID=A0A540WNX1_9BACT|nr:iron-containing redox enzyme family protein [Myxococcus llanfairpwllgwyngyllgogerychwyrndrobwllllantysiliogogogochensis]TQF10713.1 iron-containing redox enzyme family protein [Myxococcus llanfairpwllgwyngyllgogerychwyrndrobwllllantysiliogogogochensis]